MGQLEMKGEEVQSNGPNLRRAQTKGAGTPRYILPLECLPSPKGTEEWRKYKLEL